MTGQRNLKKAAGTDSIKKTALCGLLIALAFVFSYIEALLPIPFPVPGMKLGMANVVVVCAMYMLSEKIAAEVSLVRVILVGFTFGNPTSMLYSLAGAVLSLAAMHLLKKHHYHIITVSIFGGLFHNLGQLLAAVLLLESTAVLFYMPLLSAFGMATGAVLGVLCAAILPRLRHAL